MGEREITMVDVSREANTIMRAAMKLAVDYADSRQPDIEEQLDRPMTDEERTAVVVSFGVSLLGNLLMKAALRDHEVFMAQESASDLIQFVRNCVKARKQEEEAANA